MGTHAPPAGDPALPTREAFESALAVVLRRPAGSGSKWRALELLFADAGLRASGAITGLRRHRASRLRQLVRARRHAGVAGVGAPSVCILVLDGEEAMSDAADEAHLDTIAAVARRELRDVDPAAHPRCLLVLRRDGGALRLTPRRLIVLAPDALAAHVAAWYPELERR